MNGLNKRFKNNTLNFLRRTPIIESTRHMLEPPALGIVEFDLEPFSRNAAAIGDFVGRDKNPTRRSQRIEAYWLPWQPDGTSSIQLGDEADYFFTSQLAGCQIRIVPGPAHAEGVNHPLVMHIAGNVTSHTDRQGTAWRNQQAEQILTPAEFGRSRALSSTGLEDAGYRGEGVNVIGFKIRARWEFWGQQVDFEQLTVARVWQIV